MIIRYGDVIDAAISGGMSTEPSLWVAGALRIWAEVKILDDWKPVKVETDCSAPGYSIPVSSQKLNQSSGGVVTVSCRA